MKSVFLKPVHDPHAQSFRLCDLLSAGNGVFAFCMASTDTSEVEGISAAGATAAARRLTPSIDADVLVSGGPRRGEAIPVSPVGIVSPVVITHACLELLASPPLIVDCGTFRSPLVSHITAGALVARSVSTGAAIPYDHVVSLMEAGRKFAEDQIARNPGYLAISECVPGGTTTALAVLLASGLEAGKLVSSSLPSGNVVRQSVVDQGFSSLTAASFDDPIEILAAFGDPMQPFVIAAVLAAAQTVPVILGGGSQMLAVLHMARKISAFRKMPFAEKNIFVITTKWIAGDFYSNTTQLSQLVGAQFFASSPDFSRSQFAGLRAYEDGHVKEGVGAGAMMAAAYFAACNVDADRAHVELLQAIDASYRELIEKPPGSAVCDSLRSGAKLTQ